MIARGGDAVSAVGPTDLRRFIPYSVVATGAVFGFPLWIAFGLGARIGAIATVLSIVMSMALGHIGSLLWQRHPGSRDVVFNDLMAWGFVGRLSTQRRLVRKVAHLGLDTSKASGLSVEQRTALLKDLAVALETGDPYTHGHSQRVARHAHMVAKSLKLPRRVAEKIRLAGVIHDIGKLEIPREIITKPGRLTGEEFDVIKTHTTLGAEMVEMLDDPQVTDMVRHHHERLDGSGYPDRLRGEELSIGARILAVADTFDAASSLRPYRGAQKHKVALKILETEATAGRLDPKVVDAFTRYYSGRHGMGWWLVLTTSPRHLYEFGMLVLQRLGATSVASAAVVGATAMALGPAMPRHAPLEDRPRSEAQVREIVDEAGSPDGAEVAAASTTGRAGSSEGRAEGGSPGGKAAGKNDNGRDPKSNGHGGGPKEKPEKEDNVGGQGSPETAGPGSDKGPKSEGSSSSNGTGKDKDDGGDADIAATDGTGTGGDSTTETFGDTSGGPGSGGGSVKSGTGGGSDSSDSGSSGDSGSDNSGGGDSGSDKDKS